MTYAIDQLNDDQNRKETGTKYSREQLKEAFELVENKENWKRCVSKVVQLTNEDMKRVREAVIFYTGSVPTFRPVIGMPAHTFLVTADGYYRSVGA